MLQSRRDLRVEDPYINTISYKSILYTISPFSAARNVYCYYIIFRFTQTSSTQSFNFFTFTSRPLILTVKARSLCGFLFFLVKCISAYLLGINYVLCLLAYTIHQLCAAVSLLQLSAVLPPHATKLVLLTNLKLSVLFLILLKCFSSFEIKKRKRIKDNNNSYKISVNI